jgi:hypothetical protein
VCALVCVCVCVCACVCACVHLCDWHARVCVCVTVCVCLCVSVRLCMNAWLNRWYFSTWKTFFTQWTSVLCIISDDDKCWGRRWGHEKKSCDERVLFVQNDVRQILYVLLKWLFWFYHTNAWLTGKSEDVLFERGMSLWLFGLWELLLLVYATVWNTYWQFSNVFFWLFFLFFYSRL